jgi:sialic acid synthase SpsE
MFPYPVAFSDHTPGATMDIAAVAIGANLVEKTITLDRTIRSVEHIMSLEPAEMKQFVQTIADVERAMGTPRRVMHAAERKRRLAIRRSVFLDRSVKAGDTLGDARVLFRRPGFGMAPDQYEGMTNMRFRRDLPAGHMVEVTDVE